jgi:hypothetical protein
MRWKSSSSSLMQAEISLYQSSSLSKPVYRRPRLFQFISFPVDGGSSSSKFSNRIKPGYFPETTVNRSLQRYLCPASWMAFKRTEKQFYDLCISHQATSKKVLRYQWTSLRNHAGTIKVSILRISSLNEIVTASFHALVFWRTLLGVIG